MEIDQPEMGDSSPSPAEQVRAARAQGAHRFAPVRFRLIEALSQRAERHDGETRRLLDDRVTELLAAYCAALASAPAAPAAATKNATPPDAAPQRGPIADLVELLARHASTAPDGSAVPAASPGAAPAVPDQLKTMRYFSGTWSRLSADRRLRQSLVKLPENAGPLNSHQLVHRALTLMHEVSPAYLNRFMSYVDTLSGIEQVLAGSGAGAPATRADGARKAGRGKPG